MALRDCGITTEPTELSFQLLKNGQPYKAVSIVSAAVYTTEAGHTSGETPVCIINTSTGIVASSLGLYTYTIPVIPTAGTYYDVIGLDITGSGTTTYFVNSFTVSEAVYTGSTVAAEYLCKIYGYIKDASGNSVSGVLIAAYPDTVPSINGDSNTAILPQYVKAETDDTGFFSIKLMYNVAYRIAIREMAFYTKILVPKQASCELWQLTTVPEVGDTVITNTNTSGNNTVETTTTTSAEGTTTTVSTGTIIPEPSF